MNEVSKLIDRTIREVVIDSTVITIGERAFWYCTSLKSVTIGNSVTSIGERAFYRCTSLNELYFTNPVAPTIGEWTWYGLKYVYVPEGSVEAYRNAFMGKIISDAQGGYALDPSTFVFAYQVPYWEEQSYQCEVDETNTKTGMVTVVEKDTNPTSSTYNTTRQRTYEDLERCNPVSCFTKITSLDEATSGKYLIVDTAKNIALNASLIASTTSTSNGINAYDNYISVDIADDTIEATDTTLNAAVDYDSVDQLLTWTDENSDTVFYLETNNSRATFRPNALTPTDTITPYNNNNGGLTFNALARAIALFTNTSDKSKFRWETTYSASSNFDNVALFKLM